MLFVGLPDPDDEDSTESRGLKVIFVKYISP